MCLDPVNGQQCHWTENEALQCVSDCVGVLLAGAFQLLQAFLFVTNPFGAWYAAGAMRAAVSAT